MPLSGEAAADGRTDGAPNCSEDDFNGLFGGGGPADFDQMSFEASLAAIESMAKDGVKTFVLGYDANDNAQLRMSLDAMAVAGDTGDTEHHEICASFHLKVHCSTWFFAPAGWFFAPAGMKQRTRAARLRC